MLNRILVIGVGAQGPAGLSSTLLQRITRADQLWGSKRLLAYWPDHPHQIVIGADIAGRVQNIDRSGTKRIVVLASGDPGFYGIVGTLLRVLPAEALEIVPHVSSLQLAFARVGLPWSDAILVSAHSRPLSEIVGWARRAPKLGVLTDRRHTPAVIARTLLGAGLPDCRAIVAENLELPGEQITDTRLAQLPRMTFGALNVLLLIQDEDWQPRPVFAPRPDAAYAHRRGLITKRDIRAFCIAKLALRETDTVWDVGAGSGAVSIEIAELAWRGRVYAIERDVENLGYLRRNAARHGALNVSVVVGEAPGVLVGLPRPSAVFVGGTGGAMEQVLRHVARAARPGCRVVVNLATLENLVQAMQVARTLGWSPQVAQVGIAHGKAIAGLTRLAPQNPVFVLSAQVEKHAREEA